MFETNKLKQLFNKVHEKFLKAIDHMEFHPTIGKEKKGTSYRLHRCSAKDRDASMAHQMRYLSPDAIEMLKQGNEIIQKRYLKVNNTKHQRKRFGLATLILGWGVYRNAQNLMAIKRNIQILYNKNILYNQNIHSIMKVTPIIMENFLLVILTIPLADQSLLMNLYKVHNLPALHPKLYVQFEYQLEGEYLAITKDKQYAALPTA